MSRFRCTSVTRSNSSSPTNPLDPDVPLNQAIDAIPNAEGRDSLRKQTIDYTQRKSLNFTNVRKTKTGAAPKTRIYDVENLNFTYAYTEIYQRNYNIAYSLYKTHSGLIGNFTTRPVNRSSRSRKSPS